MNRTVLARVSIVVLLVVLGSSLQGAADQSSAQGQQEYLALGDSIPAGLASSLPSERGYPAILQDLMQSERLAAGSPGSVQLINLAEPGETAQSFIDDGQLDAAIEQIEASDNLRAVTLTLGGNNMLSLWDANDDERAAGLDQFRESYQQVIDELAGALDETESDVVVTTYYDLSEGDPTVEGSDAWWLGQFNQVIEETAAGAGFDVVELAETFDGRISELTWFPADVHPNNAGHEVIARAIWQQLDYDTTAPGAEITRPDESGNETSSRIPTIHATVSDDIGVETVEIVVDDETVGDLLYVPDHDAWIGIWDAREFNANEAEVTVVATDLAGNEGSDTISLRLPPIR